MLITFVSHALTLGVGVYAGVRLAEMKLIESGDFHAAGRVAFEKTKTILENFQAKYGNGKHIAG